MRQIKFRGKRIDDGEWIFGYLADVQEQYGYATINSEFDDEDGLKWETCDYVDVNTVGQFTGLHDKDGKEIYENDIFVLDELDGIISWHPNGYWCLHTAQDDVSKHSYISLGEVIEYAIRERYDYKVIGNIHEK